MTLTAAAEWPSATDASAKLPTVVTTDLTEHEWTAYVEQHSGATVDHQWGWQEVFRRVFGQESRYLAARRGGAIVGVLPLVLFRSQLFGRLAVSVPYLNYGGVLATDREATAALIEEAGRLGQFFGASYIELRHSDRTSCELPCRQHKVAMRLSLPRTPEDLWKAIDRKVRNQVRKAQKEGLSTATGGAELIDEFYAVFAENMRDLGTPVYSKRLFIETLRIFPHAARVHIVRHREKAIAGSVTVAFRDVVQVPWASALREYRQLCPNMLLYWSMLEYSISRAACVFDFGRSSTESGTHQFKQQWGAVGTEQYWEYVLLRRTDAPDHGPSNSAFASAISVWRKLPLPLANVLGPVVARHIP